MRGHTLLSKISGANAAALSAAVASHAVGSNGASNGVPSSSTSSAPQAPPANYTAAGTIGEHSIPANETPVQLEDRCRKLMEKSDVVLFMKGNPDQPRCGFSQKTVALLKQEKVPFTTFDILQDEAVRQGLKKLNDWPTFPQIIVHGELIGGLDILKVSCLAQAVFSRTLMPKDRNSLRRANLKRCSRSKIVSVSLAGCLYCVIVSQSILSTHTVGGHVR